MYLEMGRKWLPKVWWAISNAVRHDAPPLLLSHYYSAKNWVGNCPPCPTASYIPELFNLIKGHFVSIYQKMY
jgi:hypothetical protein